MNDTALLGSPITIGQKVRVRGLSGLARVLAIEWLDCANEPRLTVLFAGRASTHRRTVHVWLHQVVTE